MSTISVLQNNNNICLRTFFSLHQQHFSKYSEMLFKWTAAQTILTKLLVKSEKHLCFIVLAGLIYKSIYLDFVLVFEKASFVNLYLFLLFITVNIYPTYVLVIAFSKF